MKAVFASLFAASVVLAGTPVQSAEVNNDGAVVSGAVESGVTIMALTEQVDVVSSEEKRTDDEKTTGDDKKSDEEKKPDEEKKAD